LSASSLVEPRSNDGNPFVAQAASFSVT